MSVKWLNGRTVHWLPSTMGSTVPAVGLPRGHQLHHRDGLGPSEGDMLGGCPEAIPVARAVEMAWTPQLSGVTWPLTTQQLPGGGGPGDKGRSGEAGLHPPAPTPRPLPTSTASLTTLLRILGPSPTPVPLLPETPHSPHPFPHLPFLGLVFPFCLSPQSSPFLPSPCSIACVLLPASSPPLPFRAPGN